MDYVKFFFGLTIIFAAAYGWIANIVKLVVELNDPLTALFLLRAVGVPFMPLGVVMGYI